MTRHAWVLDAGPVTILHQDIAVANAACLTFTRTRRALAREYPARRAQAAMRSTQSALLSYELQVYLSAEKLLGCVFLFVSVFSVSCSDA